MTRYDAAVLTLRILALYFGYVAIGGLAQIAGILTGTWTEPIPILPWALPVGMYAVLAVLVFWKAPAIARGLFPGPEPLSTASRPEIGALALKVLGILLVANSIARLGAWSHLDETSNWPRMAGDVVVALIAAGLLLTAPALARRMFGTRGIPLAQPLLAHVQAVTFSVLGIWLLVSSIPLVADSLRERQQFGEWGRDSWSPIAIAAIGLLLFLGGGGLSAFWHWLRHAGLVARTERRS